MTLLSFGPPHSKLDLQALARQTTRFGELEITNLRLAKPLGPMNLTSPSSDIQIDELQRTWHNQAPTYKLIKLVELGGAPTLKDNATKSSNNEIFYKVLLTMALIKIKKGK